tara:strand:+ start:575 stop:1180 length:606 start_codon:yes stop_codon:yes gene_type:complete
MFVEIPVKLPVKNRRLVFGVGINDATYKTHIKVDGKRITCPFYVKWQGMLKRSYYQPYKDKNTTYKDVTVCDEWLVFSVFKCWMANQDWNNKELDKDILTQGNSIYSPGKCIFVSRGINCLLVCSATNKGKYKTGVCFQKDAGRFKAYCNHKGRQNHLGYFDTEIEAHNAYCDFKYWSIGQFAIKQKEPLRTALLKYKING